MRVLVGILLIVLIGAVFSACADDPLFAIGSDAGPGGDPSRIDAGNRVSRRIVWARVPSTGVESESDRHKLRVRLPPPTSHGSSSSPEHNVGSVLSGGK